MFRVAREEGGFTMVEVLVAAVVLITGGLGTLQLMFSSAKAELRAEQNDVAGAQAQLEMERIHTLGFDQVALTGPPPSTPAGGPGDRLSASCPAQGISTDGCFALNEIGDDQAPLVVEGGNLEEGGTVSGAAIDPGPDSFQVGDVSGNVYRYVVWQNDAGCHEVHCPGTQDRKRVVVVATLDVTASGGERGYRELQSDFFDPDIGKDTEPTPAPTRTAVAQQFWLTDTTCELDTATPQRIDHATANTLGACSDGRQTGGTPGAPDLLSAAPPELDLAFPSDDQPEYDLATDVEPLSDPGSDSGVQMRRAGSSGCNYTPSGADAETKVHRWVTAPMEAGFTFVFEGEATLELWTKTVSGAAADATICLWLFVRDDGSGGGPVDELVGDADNGGAPYFTYQRSSWPQAEWEMLSIPFSLEPPAGESNVRVGAGQRLGFAISVEAATSTDALQFSYDHPDFDTRFEVETATPLEPGA